MVIQNNHITDDAITAAGEVWESLSPEEKANVMKRIKARKTEIGPVPDDSITRRLPRGVKCLEAKTSCGLNLIISLEVIDRETAIEMMKFNLKNRLYNANHGKKIARALRRGKFRQNGATICMTADGYLCDGQHRLIQVIDTGIPIEVIVVRGLSEDAWLYIDETYPRGAAMRLQREGHINCKNLASALPIIMQYFLPWIQDPTRKASCMDNSDPVDYLKEHPDIERYGSRGVGEGTLSPSLTVAMGYLFALADSEQAQEWFYNQVVNGFNVKEGSPASVLRKTFKRLEKRGAKMDARHRMGLTIKAWNAHRAGRNPSYLRFLWKTRRDEEGNITAKADPLPEIYGLPRDTAKYQPDHMEDMRKT